jgi:hypothetical protein
MNYYASGGQTLGLKSLAQDMRGYGRNGDTMLAHINPEEAMILKAMGGSGTINPDTGLPEYFLKSVFKPVQQAWKGITNLPGIKQVSDAVTPVMQTLAPYAPYIAPFIPGVGPLMAAGIGAAGAGFGGKGRSGFDFKRGLMGGMTAYGLSNLYSGLQAAASTGADATASQVASNLGNNASSAAGSQADLLAQQAAGFGDAGLQNIASSASYANPASFVGSATEAGAQAIAENAPNAGMFEAAPPPQAAPFVFDKSLATSVPQSLQMPNLSSMPSKFATEMGNAGSGLKNLVGLGEGSVSQAANAIGTKFGTGSAAALFTGASGMAALDEQQKALDTQLASGSIAQSEYDAQSARIAEGRARAEQAVRDNPYQFAVGGTVSDENGMDEARGLNQGNMSMGFMSGGMPVHNVALSGMSQPAFNNGAVGGIQQFAAGGQPRFLSGGGDGMSDSIKASINGTQEARLADGEFVIPADVVSHLGNGSSKAGAKQLYSMMDKVRSARTGNPKQGKQINPRKYMPA